MALFESYERRIDQINAVLNSYGIASIEEAEKITKDAGLDVYAQIKGIQPICFENACWAYTVGAAIAIKKGCRKAADAAAAIGEGLQSFCIPGSVADTRKVGLGHGNLGKMLLEEETECFCFLAGHESFAAAEGAIGAKLLYEDDTVQHAGVIVGVEGVAFHQFLEYPEHDPGYMGRASFSQDLSAVTGACLLIRKKVYEEVGGMDEHLAVSYNDVDLCLKLREAGYLVVYDAFAHLYHYESRSRGYEDSPQKQARLAREAEYMKNKWKHVMGTDPYYNRNLSLKNGYYKLP